MMNCSYVKRYGKFSVSSLKEEMRDRKFGSIELQGDEGRERGIATYWILGLVGING